MYQAVITAVKNCMIKKWSVGCFTKFVKASLVRHLSRDQKEMRKQAGRVFECGEQPLGQSLMTSTSLFMPWMGPFP